MLWYSLEVPQWGTSNEYPQHMFLWTNKKNINSVWLKKGPYLKLWFLVEKKVSYLHLWILLDPYLQSNVSFMLLYKGNITLFLPHQAKRGLQVFVKCTDSDSSHPCTKYHPDICYPLIHSIASYDSVSSHRRPWSNSQVVKLIWAFTVRICPKTRFRMGY